MIWTGERDGYHWLTTDDHYIHTLVQICPEAFVDRYLVVTCIDGDREPWLTKEQEAAGWTRRDGFVFSPRLETTSDLFFQRDGLEIPGFDEWYLFRTAPEMGVKLPRDSNPFEAPNEPRPGHMVVVGTYLCFSLHDEETISEMFWDQMKWVQPDSYVNDGAVCLTFVTRDPGLLRAVQTKLQNVTN